jgi:hypothetical protein
MTHKEDAILTAKEFKEVLSNFGETNQVVVWETKVYDLVNYDARIMYKSAEPYELEDTSVLIHRDYESTAIFIA